jgi:hypothetical protein
VSSTQSRQTGTNDDDSLRHYGDSVWGFLREREGIGGEKEIKTCDFAGRAAVLCSRSMGSVERRGDAAASFEKIGTDQQRIKSRVFVKADFSLNISLLGLQ